MHEDHTAVRPPAQSSQVLVETLSSGLTLVAEPWGVAPVVAVQLWVAAGSSSDPEGASGAAHLLEHMVFKGAGDWEGTALTERVEALGGDLNAWTSIDQTCFHVTVPVSAFETAARLLGTMVLVPWLRADDLTPEQGVVVEEIRGAEDDPTSVLADRMRAAMWGDHPGARPVLGSDASVRGIDANELQAFHHRQYHPERLALVVAGPVSADRVRAMGAELDALLKKRTTTPPEVAPAPALRPARPGAIVVRDGHEDRHVEVLFPSPGPAHPDMAALDVLTVILGDGRGSRLLQHLRDDAGVAVHAWAAMETEQQGGMTAVGGTPREGTELGVVEALGQVVARIRAAPPSRAELTRARGLVRSDVLRERETVDGQAHRLGWYWHRFGDLSAEAAYMAAIDRVTPADVQRVARAWFSPEAAVLGVATPDADLTEEAVEAAWKRGCAAAPAVATQPAPELVQTVLPGGLRVVVEPRPDAELIGLSLIGVGGVIAEPARRAGVATAWARLLTRGAGTLSTGPLAALVEARSASSSAWAARNSVGVEVVWPAGGLAWLGWLLHEMLVAPRFTDDDLTQILDDLQIDRSLAMDDPGSLAWEGVFADLYPGHSWARPVEGTPGGLSRVDRAAVQRYHRTVTSAANLHVAVSGPVVPEEVFAVLAPLSRALPSGPARPLCPPTTFDQRGGSSRRRRVPRSDAQARVAIGVAGASLGVGGTDEAAVRVLEAVLGGAQGGGGRLFQKVREELGLAYSVGASWEGGLGAGSLVLYAGTDPARSAEVAEAMWDCCVDVGRSGVTDDELARVKAGLVDGAHQNLQRSVSRARHLAAASAYRGDAAAWKDAIAMPASVDRAAVEALAQDLFRPDRRVQVVAGPSGSAW